MEVVSRFVPSPVQIKTFSAGLPALKLIRRIGIYMRATILVAEPESLQALSVRKLVLESAKFNVLTAHSTAEAYECLKLFPNVSAAILVAEYNIECEQLAEAIKKDLPKVPVIALSAREGYKCPGADHHLSSHNPEHLIELARKLLGDPRTTEVQKNKMPSEVLGERNQS